MDFDTEKICRTCLSLTGPLLSIYNDNGSNTVADMLENFTSMKLKKNDGLPEKVCLTCISEINRSYSFKMKCENSEQMLRQLVSCPDMNERVNNPNASNISVKDEKICESRKLHNCLKPERDNSYETTPVKNEKKGSKKENFITEVDPEEGDKRDSQELPESSDENSVREDDETDGETVETAYYLISETQEDNVEQTFEEIGSHNEDINDDQVQISTTKEGNKETENQLFIPEGTTNNEICKGYSIVKSDDDNEKEAIIILNHTTGRKRRSTTKKLTKQMKKEKKIDLKCSYCAMTFVFLRNLHKHVQKHHPEKNKDSESNEENHNTSNSNKNIKIKDQEKLSDSTKKVQNKVSDYLRLRDAKLPVVEANYHCPRCNAGFAQKKSCNNHLLQNKCTAETFVCSECKKVFLLEANLEEHMKTHTSQFDCTECRETFSQKDQLTAHMIEAHNRNTRYQCHYEDCKKVFTMLSTLKDHIRTHTGEKPFLCSVCGKGFSQAANLKQHVMRHNKTKPYQCDECPTSFVSKAELFSHKRTHSGDHPFSCEVCRAEFTTSSSLVKHRRKHTGERPYGCEFCPMRFTALNVLKNHRRTHTGEKPYVCHFCNRGFAQKSDCTIHMRIHTGGRRSSSSSEKLHQYVCNVCDNVFDDNEMLEGHLKMHFSESETNDVGQKKVLQRSRQHSSSVVTYELFSEEDITDDGVNEDEEFVQC